MMCECEFDSVISTLHINCDCDATATLLNIIKCKLYKIKIIMMYNKTSTPNFTCLHEIECINL